MAKSIRSQSKRKYRAIKRENVFAPVELERCIRLAKMQEKTKDTTPYHEQLAQEEAEKALQSGKPVEVDMKDADTAAVDGTKDGEHAMDLSSDRQKKKKRFHRSSKRTRKRTFF